MDMVHIRPLKEEDSERMLEWMRDPDITHYLQVGGADTSKETVLRFIERSHEESNNLHFAIADEQNNYLGTISLKNINREKNDAEYAISMHPAALGTGASAEGSRLILQKAFDELGLERVYLNVLEDNKRAVRFYTKFGFRYTHSSELVFKGDLKKLLWFEARKEP